MQRYMNALMYKCHYYIFLHLLYVLIYQQSCYIQGSALLDYTLPHNTLWILITTAYSQIHFHVQEKLVQNINKSFKDTIANKSSFPEPATERVQITCGSMNEAPEGNAILTQQMSHLLWVDTYLVFHMAQCPSQNNNHTACTHMTVIQHVWLKNTLEKAARSVHTTSTFKHSVQAQSHQVNLTVCHNYDAESYHIKLLE